MRLIYTWIFRLLTPVIIMRLLWRSRKAPAYRRRWQERFAWNLKPVRGSLWLHAVSLGESIAATPLLKEFMVQFPHIPVVVTNMTPTGSEQIRAVFGGSVFNLYVPYDLPGVIKRFLKAIQPRLIVIMETELWPNILHYAHRANIPILLGNGRLSERSARKYSKIKKNAAKMLQCITLIAAQTEIEAKRFIQLGAHPDAITVTGNIKFNIQIPGDLEDKAQGLRRQIGEDRVIWIAASTHEGEDEIILNVFSKIKPKLPQLLLILVPRHPERFQKVAHLCQKRRHEIICRSENKPCTKDTDVYIGDTMGELMLFYAISDLAFVGGSLISAGGHNLLEPAALGKAAITGHHMHNFVSITSLLLQAQAIKQVQNEAELEAAVLFYLMNKEERILAGSNGRKVVLDNKGALQQHLALISELIAG